MNRTLLHKIIAALLVSALAFGQVGAGFLHKTHDAHEAVIDLEGGQPVLLNHGEHCKVCAMDWVDHAEPMSLGIVTVRSENGSRTSFGVTSAIDQYFFSRKNRAPPIPA